MANRVTEAEVLAIMNNSLEAADVLPFITGANVFITDLLADGDLSDETLKEIERWLSAHMVAVSKDRVLKEAGASGAEAKWAGSWGEELSSTQFGQMVLMLDTTNTLRDLKANRRAASIYVVPGV